MKKNDKTALWIFGGIVGLLLLSSPNCDRGCQTLAEHLLTHSLDKLF